MNQPFDLAKMDFERQRRNRRRKLLLRSLAPVVILLLVGLKLVSLGLFTHLGQTEYQASRFDSAANYFHFLSFVNVIERYKAPFNLGTSLYKQGRYADAQKQLETALQTVTPDHECDVRLNLGLTIEAQADAKAAQKSYDEAIVLYDQAKSVLTANHCQPDENTSKKDKNDKNKSDDKVNEANKRVSQKSDDTKRARNGDKNDNNQPPDKNNQDSQQPSQSQTQQLEKQNQTNQAARMKRQRTNKIDYSKNLGPYDRVVW